MNKKLDVEALVIEPAPSDEKNLINVKAAVSKEIMSPEEFGKAFLTDRVLHKNVRDALGLENENKKSRDTEMDR